MAQYTAAEIGRVVARVVGNLGARNEEGTFAPEIGDDRFTLEEIVTAVIETESEIASDLAESMHPKRIPAEWSDNLENGESLPPCIGEIEQIRIQPFSESEDFVAAEKTSRENIRRWRENYNHRFDAVDHDEEGSGLAGYYDITNDVAEFTGYALQVKACFYEPDIDGQNLQIAVNFEAGLGAGAIPKLYRNGTPNDLVKHYAGEYDKFRNSIRQGHDQVYSVQTAQIANSK